MARRNSNKPRTSIKKELESAGFKSSQPKIRWKPEEKTELARLVRNYNQKRRRAISRGVPEKALPPVVWGKNLRDDVITTRKDLKREIASLERFMKADLNEIKEFDYVKLTKYEIDEAKRLIQKGNKAVAKERKRLEQLGVTSFGKNTGLTVGQMGDVIERGALRPLELNVGSKERWQWDKYMEMLRKRADTDYIESKNWQMRQNYLFGLFRTQGINSYTLKIADSILNRTPGQFVADYYKEKDTSTFAFEYDNNIGEVSWRTQKIYEHYVGSETDDLNTKDFDNSFGNNSNGEFDKVYDLLKQFNEWETNKYG